MTRAKFKYIRSPALLKACREIPCQHCGIEDGTVVAAHSNESRHGKGRGIKASDIYIAALCAKCQEQVHSICAKGIKKAKKTVSHSHGHCTPGGGFKGAR